MPSLGVFALAALLGYFLLPLVLKKETLHLFLSHTTSSEADWRDKSLKFMTDRLTFLAPNAVSLFGFVLVFLLIYLFSISAPPLVIFLTALFAGFTDMLDGSLARNNNRVTKLGAMLDVSRDLFLALTLGYFLIIQGFLREEFFWWFFTGWIFLGFIRMLEFKASGGNIFSSGEDYKFALDRVRLTLAWIGVLLLILIPYSRTLDIAAETLIIMSISISWLSLLFHSAHLRILREEKRGYGETAS
ncbi:hypothetical protein A3B26_03365 [Candidatus Giovannonibacteria bacterium RIFCSPLOWO2_01_FULL_48_47]|nr:MAG: hypothetical protein A3D61_02075 [Candidatus Giovannonibacteria bacterium RIFCSPHIGHO2_02_FULL_48_15]OGF88623.1 MAG: hypothetical protein A3B26_03365 [Candidatus Giovannonibacteria bacterium RIFCSPLOWO2_01_FULL_48_47]OGF94857.1 MAG: hypothetical protein A2433_02740 [Candidatus Giovannonibacteria bacterium RIFOXYC1_FULL_48_8]OGF95954.1 MAG: hypothetical protein A2613_00035 [Candidatus Giovannonibacteria bacterium RIFOXYD1_FULL_48_21]